MNEEYLNKEAIIYSANIKASYPEDVDDNTLEYECHKAFLKGARWHESLPLAERLSESEKERIREIYNNLDYEDKGSWSMKEIAEYAMQNQRKRKILESIFGKTLFTPTEQ